MCQSADCTHGAFAGFDDLDDFDSLSPVSAAPAATVRDRVSAAPAAAVAALFEETCKACRGRGKFISYSGRVVGDCFKCKGRGKVAFKSSPEARAKAKQGVAARKERDANLQRIEAQAWLDANPAYAAFLRQDWEFPRSLAAALDKWGSLTSNQTAAIDRLLVTQAAREAERAAQAAAAPAAPAASGDLDLSSLPSGRYAVPGGDTRLKLLVQQGTGKWLGWTFVKDAAAYGEGEKYGSQRPGSKYRGRVVEQLRAILADPFEASCAYGRLVGSCGVCGRPLEDATSVANGIGPVCASKFPG